jgi:hypothetical protein
MPSKLQLDFDAFIASLNLLHFRPHEVRFLGGSHYDQRSSAHGLNTLPPRSLWKNIIPALRAADNARYLLGGPIRILSAYRSPAYNTAIGGASKSLHMTFHALDLAPLSHSPTALRKILRDLRKKQIFTGGIGTYATFIHIDNRGTNVDF